MLYKLRRREGKEVLMSKGSLKFQEIDKEEVQDIWLSITLLIKVYLVKENIFKRCFRKCLMTPEIKKYMRIIKKG